MKSIVKGIILLTCTWAATLLTYFTMDYTIFESFVIMGVSALLINTKLDNE